MELYVLTGSVFVPGNESSTFGENPALPFRIDFKEGRLADDSSAIAEAEKFVASERKCAKPGYVIFARLKQGERIVKDFPAKA